MPKDMMVRGPMKNKKKQAGLRFSIVNSKTLHVKCTCHDEYEYTLRINTKLKDKDLDNMSDPDFTQWVAETTGLSYTDFAKLHKDFADIPLEERMISWDEI